MRLNLIYIFLISLQVWAQSTQVPAEWDDEEKFTGKSYLQQIKDINNSYASIRLSHDDLSPIRKIAYKAQDLFWDRKWNPRLKEALNTPEGLELKKRHSKAINFLTIKDNFNTCLAGGDYKIMTDTHRNILDEASRASLMFVECNPVFLNNQGSYTGVNHAILENKVAMHDALKSPLQDILFEQSLDNQISSYMSVRYALEVSSISFIADATTKRFCTKKAGKKSLDLCDEKTKDGKAMKQIVNKLVAKNSRLLENSDIKRRKHDEADETGQDIAGKLNAKIHNINDVLDAVQVPDKPGRLWGTNADYDEIAQIQHSLYQQQFAAEMGEGLGYLLATKTIREKITGVRKLDEAKKRKDRKPGESKYGYQLHSPNITPNDVWNARQEILNTVVKQGNVLIDMQLAKQQDYTDGKTLANKKLNTHRDRDLKRLIRTNAPAVGQLLINHPEYSDIVCELIYELEAEEESDRFWKSAWTWGSVAVGAALIATGIGAAAGSFVLYGGLTAGALTTLKTVAVAGTVMGLAGGAGNLLEMRAAEIRESRFRGEFLSSIGFARNPSPDLYFKAEAALDDYESAKLSAIINFGFSAIDLGALGLVSKVSGMVGGRVLTATEQLNRIKAATEVLKKFSESPGLARAVNLATRSAEIGKEGMAKFLGHLANLSDGMRLKLYQALAKVTNGSDSTVFTAFVQKVVKTAEVCKL